MKHGWKDIWHYLPSLIHLVSIMPYLIKPWAFKLHFAEEMMQDVHHMVMANDLVLYPVIVNMIMRPISWISYTGYSLYLVLRFQRRYPFERRIPIKDAKRILRFMVIFLVICLLTELSYTALSIEYFLSFDKPTVEFINTPWIWAINLGIAAIPFSLILYPEILYGIPRVRENELELIGAENTTQLAPGKTGFMAGKEPEYSDESPHKRGETENNFQQLAARIIEVMDKKQPYLEPDFSPDDLANLLDVPKHHLYYCFNSILNTRFTRLRAEYRVRYAQNLIEKGETRQKTLEAIGLESGFSNRISFNNPFREVTGFSPTEFLRKQAGGGS